MPTDNVYEHGMQINTGGDSVQDTESPASPKATKKQEMVEDS